MEGLQWGRRHGGRPGREEGVRRGDEEGLRQTDYGRVKGRSGLDSPQVCPYPVRCFPNRFKPVFVQPGLLHDGPFSF